MTLDMRGACIGARPGCGFEGGVSVDASDGASVATSAYLWAPGRHMVCEFPIGARVTSQS